MRPPWDRSTSSVEPPTVIATCPSMRVVARPALQSCWTKPGSCVRSSLGWVGSAWHRRGLPVAEVRRGTNPHRQAGLGPEHGVGDAEEPGVYGDGRSWKDPGGANDAPAPGRATPLVAASTGGLGS